MKQRAMQTPSSNPRYANLWEQINAQATLQAQDIIAGNLVPDDDHDYPVNLVEALIGWKSWWVNTEGHLYTQDNFIWQPGQQVEATCKHPREGMKHKAPTLDCSCGIYAADGYKEAHAYNYMDTGVTGQVYGWGRYVRGTSGWRAQYAYPKLFHILPEQVNLIDALREYHVPIFVIAPTLIYNPKEDGYEHGQGEEDGDFGTGAESDSEEG